jgi:LysR family hydrogen peroxide-inducible transcriptional activator
MVSLQQLRYLESLAETRHFGHAAQACSVSQPALSMQIKELEDELSVSLVERRKSGIELTAQGEEIARRVRTILAAVRDLLDYAKYQEGVLSGVLKAQDLAAQAGLCPVRGVVTRGRAPAGKTRAQVAGAR